VIGCSKGRAPLIQAASCCHAGAVLRLETGPVCRTSRETELTCLEAAAWADKEIVAVRGKQRFTSAVASSRLRIS